MRDNINIDDTSLVRRSQHGDSEAMSCLIVKYQDRVYSSILKICQNPDDALELTQDTFVKVFEKIVTFRSESSFYTWLFRIAMNLTLNFCKRRLSISMVSLDAVKDGQDGERAALAAVLSDTKGPDPAELAQKREVVQIVTHAIGQLPDDFRAVLVLRDIEKMSYDQIANVLELEVGTVKSRLSRARAQLRDVLETVLT